MDPIQAYCEKLCFNFTVIFNRWAKLPISQKFNYAAPEINKKFRQLSKREYNEQIPAPKDYNLIVDNIMTLTGTYSARAKPEKSPDTSRQSPKETVITRSAKAAQQAKIEAEKSDTKIFLPDMEQEFASQQFPTQQQSFPRQSTFESTEEVPVRRTTRISFQRQESFSQLLTNFANLKRADPYELKDKGIHKKIKWEPESQDYEDLERDKMVIKTELNEPRSQLVSRSESENFFNLDQSFFSQKASNPSQNADEGMGFSRLNSAFSFPFEK